MAIAQTTDSVSHVRHPGFPHVSPKDFELARRVHECLLPRSMTHPRIAIDVRFRPRDGLGGDYCQIVFVDEATLYATMCDVTGHGLGAAMLAARVSTTVRNLIEARLSPCTIVQRVDSTFWSHFAESDLLLSFLAVRIDLTERVMTYSGAGHPGPLIVPAGAGPVASLLSQSPFIGVPRDGRPATSEHTLSLSPGDRIALFTDGLIEARAADGSMQGPKGLGRLLAAGSGMDVFTLGRHVMDSLEVDQAGPQQDDQTLILAELQ